VCKRCSIPQSESAFYGSSLRLHIYLCKQCLSEHMSMYRAEQRRASPYYAVLHRLRRAERKRWCDNRDLLRCLEPGDIQWLVETAFSGRSALSGATEDLVLSRFRVDTPFSLSNCVCLTRKEAIRHERASELTALQYPDDILRRIAEQQHRSALLPKKVTRSKRDVDN
jgi:hypothetical protein